MDNFSSEKSVINITNGRIDNIDRQGNTTFVMVSYRDNRNQQREQNVRLVVGNNTIILNENGNTIRVRELRTGMMINAVVSSAMTRSIPPQTTAFEVRVL